MSRARSDGDDERIFADAMTGVRPLDWRSGRTLVCDSPTPAPCPARTPAAKQQTLLDIVERCEERYAMLALGADRRLVRALRAGQPPPEAQLDLHRRDEAGARGALRRFLEDAHARGQRCLLVIHGRGKHSGPAGAVLRDCVIDELGRPPLAACVLAVASAPGALGGTGAALVLLRRRR